MRAQLIEFMAARPARSRSAAVGEQLLDDPLAVVERALDRDRVHVGGVDRRHLAPLDVAHAALGVEHDDLGAATRRETRDGRRAGVTGGRHEHGDALVALAQDVLEEPADELQGEILEGQRGAVEELQQPLVGVELDERADGRVAEARVGLGAQPLQQRGLELVARERPDHARGDARIARSRARARERGPALGHVQAAVAREAGEQRVAEAERRSAAAGRDVAHGSDGRGRGGGDWLHPGRSASLAPDVGRRRHGPV